MRKEVIGDCTLYLGDCMDVFPIIGDVDAVVTDPPYGIKRDGKPKSTSSHGGHKGYEFIGWDSGRPSKEVFEKITSLSGSIIIWGGNYFSDLLPPTSKWLIWDKGQRIDQADAELAWTSFDGAIRIKTLNRVEIAKDGAVHPTQKPVKLMSWCIDQIRWDAQIFFDPFMGSGTTGVSCVMAGKSFIGVEKHESYFELACERIRKAYSQPDMLVELSKSDAMKQGEMI